MMKSLNDRPARLPMMMFGGSPIRVADAADVAGHGLRDQEQFRADPEPGTDQQGDRSDE